jgi:CarD family transcriptional regulator
MRRQEEAASWSRRYKLNVERLASGDLDRVTQAVVELERREREAGLTPGEWRQLARARRMRRLLGGG